jgi:hypothetical protein
MFTNSLTTLINRPHSDQPQERTVHLLLNSHALTHLYPSHYTFAFLFSCSGVSAA